MTESDDSGFQFNPDLETPHANQIRGTTDQIIIDGETWPDELAIFDTRDEVAGGAWISAIGESFVSLDDWR